MASTLLEFFSSYEKVPATSECHQQLGALLKRSSPQELQRFLLTYRPEEVHLQLLRALAARATSCREVLLEGVRDSSKEVSMFCTQSSALYDNADGHNKLYDPEFLLPLLQAVSRRTRSRLVANLSKYTRPDGPTQATDWLFDAIANVWGPATALPLLCRASEALLRRELGNWHCLSSFQLVTIAARFPRLALSYLEACQPLRRSVAVARHVVRVNFPASLRYCVENPHDKLLSNAGMKYVLKKHLDVVMAAPTKWAQVLDIEVAKKVLKPGDLESLVVKQLESEAGATHISYKLYCDLQRLSRSSVSCAMRKAGWTERENFWEDNEMLLQLLDHCDRSRMSSALFAKTKSLEWVPLMTCDLSIPLIKERLQAEADASARARLVGKLLETVEINGDRHALAEICDFVAVRYRNDRDVLLAFFDGLPELESVGEKTWTVVYSLASKLHDSAALRHNCGIDRVFSTALRRNGKAGLKIYVDRCFSESSTSDAAGDFASLDAGLREECVARVFNDKRIACSEPQTIRVFQSLLSAITQWNATSSEPVGSENINEFLLNHLDSESVVGFVLGQANGLKTAFLLQCFELSGHPDLLLSVSRKQRGKLAVSRAAVAKMGEWFISAGLWKHISFLKTLRKRGNSDVLRTLAEVASAAVNDPDCHHPRHAVLLLSLATVDVDLYLQAIDPLLSDTPDLTAPFSADPEASDAESQEETLRQSERKESVFKGIGNSFSHFDRPSLIVSRLLKFCVGGDLMLFVRDSVYSVCFSLPGPAVEELLSLLVRKPVSVQKHALRIHRAVSSVGKQRDFLLTLAGTERHITTRTVLLEYALASLTDSRRPEIWEAVRAMMARLTPKDKALATLLLGKQVPAQFWEEYVKLLLEKSEALEDEEIEFVSNVLQKIVNSVTSLPISDGFHESLIKSYFLSNRYFPTLSAHSAISSLCVAYLEAQPGGDQASIERKKHFLLERLTCCATQQALVSYDKALCCFPMRALLDSFLLAFTASWMQQKFRDKTENRNDLRLFAATLLDFIAQFDEHLLFASFVRLSVAAILTREVSEGESAGCLVGQLVDGTLAKNPGLAQYALPSLLDGTLALLAPSESRVGFLRDLLHPPQTPNPASLLLRKITVARMLPTGWQSDKSLGDFRWHFVELARNTPAEILVTQG